MKDPERYARMQATTAPEDRVGPCAVTVYAADGVTITRTIPPAELLARVLPHPMGEAPAVAPGSGDFFLPTVSQSRRRKAALSLTRRNKARRKAR